MCGTEKFGAPRVSKLPTDGGGYGWSLSYQRKNFKQRRSQRGDTSTVLIVEYSTNAPPPQARGKGVVEKVIAGRRVVFRAGTLRTPASVAQWKTKRAYYSVITDGTDTSTITRLVGCMP